MMQGRDRDTHICVRAISTLALLAGAVICSSSSDISFFRYHHWISKDMGAELTALKAQGILTSSPSPTLTSLGTSVNVALVCKGRREKKVRRQFCKFLNE